MFAASVARVMCVLRAGYIELSASILTRKAGAKNQQEAKMALKLSPEFKGVIVQIVCVVEIQFESV